jgi:hypothetical protein
MLNCGANLTGDAWTTEMRVDDCCGSDSRDAGRTLCLFDNAFHRVFAFQFRGLLRRYCILSDVYFESMNIIGTAHLLRLRVDAVDM